MNDQQRDFQDTNTGNIYTLYENGSITGFREEKTPSGNVRFVEINVPRGIDLTSSRFIELKVQ